MSNTLDLVMGTLRLTRLSGGKALLVPNLNVNVLD